MCSFQVRWLSRWIPKYFVLGDSGICILLKVTAGHCSLRRLKFTCTDLVSLINRRMEIYIIAIGGL
jgi:hypothetical protein